MAQQDRVYPSKSVAIYRDDRRKPALWERRCHASRAGTSGRDCAQAADFISRTPDGFDAHLAEGGTNFSGGQKQRLAIARAVIRQPEIYIFDDSFSALDYQTDAKLRARLKKETTESTVLIVAQRVGTIMNADKIVVLNEGDVVGIGTHKELLQTCPVYYDIAASQLSEEELAQ
nr:ABC transporter ATP-binding protein [Enterococcus innesii]